jgi:hypothetical protein
MTGGEAGGWSEEYWRDDILRRQLRLRCNVVRNLAQNLKHGGDFPTHTPERLCDLISHSVSLITKYLDVTPYEHLAYVNLFLCLVAEHLRFVERSRVAHTPWSMIQATEQFLARQVGIASHFILRPQWSCNYSLSGEFIQYHRTAVGSMSWIPPEEWEEGLGDLGLVNKQIYCIAFPRIERLNALLHANWGHELGHIFAARWVQGKFGQLWAEEEGQIKARMQKAIEERFPQLPDQALFRRVVVDQRVSGLASTAMRAARQGLTELICDAIGLHLFGPAALAASIEFSAGLSLDESPTDCDMYPPWRYRLRLMFRACQDDFAGRTLRIGGKEVAYPGPVMDAFCKWLGGVERVVAQDSDRAVLSQDMAIREAYDLISGKWETIRAEALGMLPGSPQKPYRLTERIQTIENLVDKLEHDIPPSEVGVWPHTSTASFEDIINAAWVFKANKLTQDKEWGSVRNIEKLYKLILKAIEAGFVQSTFGPKLAELDVT